MKIEIFDPVMCCSTGICGPGVDTNLLRVATAVDKLKKKGIDIARYQLTSQPEKFISNPKVNQLINENPDCLPITLINGEVVKINEYLSDTDFELLMSTKSNESTCNCSEGCC